MAASALFRRVLPAIAATFLYIPIWQTLDTVIRSQLVQSITVYFSVTSNAPDLSRQDWLISQGYVDRSGVESTAITIPNACASRAEPPQPSLLQCLASQGYRQFVSYHPASHFWPMQASEGAVLLALTLLLAGAAYWALQRRII